MYILQNISSFDDIVLVSETQVVISYSYPTHLGTQAQQATSMLGTPRVQLSRIH
jgi:hypothetical protein